MRRNKDFNQFNRGSEAIPALSVLNERETMEAKIKKIRELNDNLRQTFTGGRVLITRGVAELPTDKQLEIMERVKNFNQFTKNNDPNGEHDFGAFDIDGITYFWKIDYYDLDYLYLSLDPSESSITNRVLTIIRADEY